MIESIIETYYHPFEFAIPGAGQKVAIEQPLPLDWDKATGILIVNPGGSHGKGTLELSIGGEEIFPSGFHARAFMQILSSDRQHGIIIKETDKYMYPIEEAARGSTVQVTYTEPSNGSKGILYLYIKLTREAKFNHNHH